MEAEVSTRVRRRTEMRQLHGTVFLVVVFMLLIVAGFWVFDGWQVVQTLGINQSLPPTNE